MLQTPVPLPAEVFITEELARRPPKKTNYRQEKRALQEIASQMAGAPQMVLPRFVQLAMEMTEGTSAGLSLYEKEAGLFRWHHVVGALAAFDGATTPRSYSPCGVTLDAAAPVLTRHAEVLYSWIADAGIVVPEVLLVPLYIGGEEPLGTLWIVSDVEGHFDRGHARVTSELATSVGVALKIQRTEDSLRQALEERELLVREMQHRIKNIFALVASMVRFSSRSSDTKTELAETLSGRLQALANAHSMVLHGADDRGHASDLRAVILAVVEPHENMVGSARFSIEGETLPCSEQVVNSIALIIHELATNAVKYGALSTGLGDVAIGWKRKGDTLELRWQERGGPEIASPPKSEGFGGRLIDSTVTRHFDGTVAYDWDRAGLTVVISLPLRHLLQ